MVSSGECWLSLEERDHPISLTSGDCFVLAPGSAYALGDTPLWSAQDISELFAGDCGGVSRFGGGGAPTTIIGGRFAFGTAVDPLLDLLPPLILIRANQGGSAALRATLELLASETAAPAPGSPLVINRLADILFIHAIRAYIASNPSPKTRWLRALADPPIGSALKAMHEKLDHPWTVMELAFIAGMSRSTFAQHFKELVGQTPLEYLTRWRMYKAGRLLRDHDKKLFEVATSVGYESDGAFHKAFKRVLGVTPGEYRRSADV
jgi:AraC-like DNA-binding protein